MLLKDWLHWVKKSLTTSRLRSLLTALGIGIGIAAVALLTSIGEGIRLYLLNSFSQFGTHILQITPGKTLTQGMGGLISTTKPITIDQAEAIRQLHYVEGVVPVTMGTGRIEAGQYSRSTDIFGVNHEVPEVWRFNVASGRFLPADDAHSTRPYAVLGAKLKKELFANKSALGKFIRVGGMRYRVIGVMESKGQLLGFDLDDVIYIPINRALQLFNREGLMEVDVTYHPSISSKKISENVRELFIRLHGNDDVTILTQEDMLNSLDNILSMLKLAIAAIGGISLLVGGVGVLTIMTTAMQERRQEIGLLRAIGTTRHTILGLFLGEAIALALAGGLLGLISVVLLIILLNITVPGLPLSLHPTYLLLSLGLAAIIGLFAGLSPANQAAKLNPIDALRAE